MVIDKLTASPVAAPKSATQTDASEIQSDESTDESHVGGTLIHSRFISKLNLR